MLHKITSLILSFCLLFTQTGLAQAAAVELNLSGYFSRMAGSMAIDKFRPLHLRSLSYDAISNNFNLLVDKGDFQEGAQKGTFPKGTPFEQKLKEETKELLNYFFIGLALPNESFWVNLRPDSPNNIIDDELAKTDVGRIFLEADLQLKKDTANFTSPQTPEGREYWDKLYKKAEELYGSENITIPTLTRPWIVPGEIIIRESKDNAYIYKATLKVMLEQDYLKDSTTYSFKDQRSQALNEYSSQLIKELIIPKLTKEVNSSKRYAPLRQVYYSLILAQWFKQKFPQQQGPNLTSLASKEDWDKTTYFNAYKKSFAEGEYNIKDPVYTPTGQVIRSYFSGGVMAHKLAPTFINIASSSVGNKDYLVSMRLSANGKFESLPPMNQQDPVQNNPGSSPLDEKQKYFDAIRLHVFMNSSLIIRNLKEGLKDSDWRVRWPSNEALMEIAGVKPELLDGLEIKDLKRRPGGYNWDIRNAARNPVVMGYAQRDPEGMLYTWEEFLRTTIEEHIHEFYARELLEIIKTRPEFTGTIIEKSTKYLSGNPFCLRWVYVQLLLEIAKVKPEYAEDIIRTFETGLTDDNYIIRQNSACAMGRVLSEIDFSRCSLYGTLVQKKLGHYVYKEDMFFILSSLSDNLWFEKSIGSEESVVDFVLQEKWPLYKEAKEEFARINGGLDETLKYDAELFWENNSFLFNRLINIAPDLARKFFIYYLSLNGEQVSGPQRMAYLFEDLKPILENRQAALALNKIISRLPKKQMSPAKLLEVFRLAQGCFILNRQDVLKAASEEDINSVDGVVEYIGSKLLKDLLEALEIKGIPLNARTTANWLSRENPWQIIIAFTTFYRRFKQAGFSEELWIIKKMAENVLAGTYERYRYDDNGQLGILNDLQQKTWKEKSVTHVGGQDIDGSASDKVERIKDSLKDSVGHAHIGDSLIVSVLHEISDDSAEARANTVLSIIKKAGQLINSRDLAALQEMEYFRTAATLQQAELILSKLRISYEILALFNISAQDVQGGRISLKKQSVEMSIEKFISGLKDKLDRIEEHAAAADIQNILENIIRIKSGYTGRKQVTIEDTDDPFILISIGEKPVSTCQGYNYPDIGFCRCLPAYLGDANKKIVLVRQNGIPVARAVIRLMKTGSGKPVIFLEKIYSSVAGDFKKYILEHLMRKKAAPMGIDIATQLEIGGITARLSTIGRLISTGTRNSYEYSDAKRGKQYGIWEIKNQMNIISLSPAKTNGFGAVSPAAADSANTSASPIQKNHDDLGGIDMRHLAKNTVIENRDSPLRGQSLFSAVQSPAGTVPVFASKELEEIQHLIQAGIIPATKRLEECRGGCSAEALLSCIADILRIEEERVTATEPGLKKLLVLIEKNR